MLKLQQIVKDYQAGDTTVHALRGVSLQFRESEFVAILGHSGCGKTTTLRVIAGFVTPKSGNVFFDGKDIANMPPYKRPVHTVFQKYALFPHLNVFENVAFGLRLKKMTEDEIRPKVLEMLEIVGLQDEKRETVVTGIEMFHKLLDYAEAGDNIGTLLRGVAKNEIERGQVLSKPGSIHPHTKFVGQVYVLTKDEGGRHTPFFNNYRPQFYFRTTDVTGIITLPEGTEMCMPGDNVDMKVELITPIAIEKGLRFAIREGGRTVGSGVVIAINEYFSACKIPLLHLPERNFFVFRQNCFKHETLITFQMLF